MADFLTTKKITSEIEEIIKKAKQKIYIVTPYLRLSTTFYERLLDATKRNVEVSFIYGKNELSAQDQELMHSLNINIYWKENLHAKCYANEETALITSMNLHTYSQSHNREFGILLDKNIDKKTYNDCIEEINSILSASEQRQIAKTENEPADFITEWHKYLKKTYPKVNFVTTDYCIYATSFPKSNVIFSTEYGFATLYFTKQISEEQLDVLQKKISRYRLYSHGKPHKSNSYRICLYHKKNIEFKNINENIQYCAKGLDILLNFAKDTF